MIDPPRLLAPSGRRSDTHGYTDQPMLAMRDEPEALTEDQHVRHVLRWAVLLADQEAAVREARLEQQRQRLGSLEERLVQARRDARLRRVDVSREARLLEWMLLGGKQARHVEARLVALERRVYR